MKTSYTVCDTYGFRLDDDTYEITILFQDVDYVFTLEEADLLASYRAVSSVNEMGDEISIEMKPDRLISVHTSGRYVGEIEEVVVAKDLRARFIEFLDLLP